MATLKLKVEVRDERGRRNASRIRSKGFIPGVIYGHNKETKSIKVRESELQRFLNRHGSKSAVTLDMNGEMIPTIIKEVQRHITKDNLLHIDFQQLSENEKIKIKVPIVLVGREKVENSTTIVQQQLMELNIQCLPKYMPKSITVDVSDLKPGDCLTIEDLEIDSNVEVLNDNSEIVASLTSATLEEEPEEEKEVPIYMSDKSILDK